MTMHPRIRRAIVSAVYFEVRDDPDDVDPISFERLAKAEACWRQKGGILYAIHPIDGETVIASD